MGSFTLSSLFAHEARNKVYGLVPAVVTDNKDTTGAYRVRVRFPWLSNGDANGEQSAWCRIATLGAGKDRGVYCLPEIGDEVVVAFEHGDFDRPIVLGSCWNGDATVHADNKTGKNNIRRFKSRSGHILELCDDSEGKKEKITLSTKAGATLVLDDTNGALQIQLHDATSDNFLTLDATGKKITLQTKTGDILIKAKNKLRLEAETIETQSDKETNAKIGSNFKIDAGTNFVLKGGSQGDVESGAVLTIKGSIVEINPNGGGGGGGGGGGAGGGGSSSSSGGGGGGGAAAATKSSSSSAASSSAASSAAAAAAPASPPPADPAPQPDAWIEIALVDQDGQPVPFQAYEITASDGTKRSGTTDGQGKARENWLKPGDCKITFPGLHDWKVK